MENLEIRPTESRALPTQPPVNRVVVRNLTEEQDARDDDRGMFDLVLRGQEKLSRLLTDEKFLAPAVQKLVAISVAGFGVHGFVVGAAMQWLPSEASSPWLMLRLPFAFAAAFLLALGICLPSFYFYTQLSGFDASFRLVTAQALRTNATTSVLLLGLAPFYGAYVLACGLGYIPNGAESAYALGYLLPFVVGVVGLRALYVSFDDLVTVLPQTHQRRGNVLQRMVLCWGAVYAVIAPVALWRLAGTLPVGLDAIAKALLQ
jgi:hypothetical protein